MTMRIIGYTSMEDRQTWLTAEQLLHLPYTWVSETMYLDIETDNLDAACQLLATWFSKADEDVLRACTNTSGPLVIRIRCGNQLLRLTIGEPPDPSAFCMETTALELHAWTNAPGMAWVQLLRQLELSINDHWCEVTIHQQVYNKQLEAYLEQHDLHYQQSTILQPWRTSPPIISIATELAQWPIIPHDYWAARQQRQQQEMRYDEF